MATHHPLAPNFPLFNMPASPASPASPYIFIVEENLRIAHMITSVLTIAGYHYSVGELTALSYEHPPTLILLDLSILSKAKSKALPDVEAQYSSRGVVPPPPIIVMTTSSIIQKEVETMGYRVLLKPFHVKELRQAIHEALSARMILA
ncbi:MAG TPA: hypothetical protein VFB60_16275 [Ktedonobacteraceae bacterium]|nr:hypothetical protein [Ktedonobacteraceae bacterium]